MESIFLKIFYGFVLLIGLCFAIMFLTGILNLLVEIGVKQHKDFKITRKHWRRDFWHDTVYYKNEEIKMDMDSKEFWVAFRYGLFIFLFKYLPIVFLISYIMYLLGGLIC